MPENPLEHEVGFGIGKHCVHADFLHWSLSGCNAHVARCGELIALGPCFSVRRNEAGSLSEERKLLRFHPQCAVDLDPRRALLRNGEALVGKH